MRSCSLPSNVQVKPMQPAVLSPMTPMTLILRGSAAPLSFFRSLMTCLTARLSSFDFSCCVSADSFAMLGFWCEAPFDSFVVRLLCSTFLLSLSFSEPCGLFFDSLSTPGAARASFGFFVEPGTYRHGTHIIF
jgi:hypothetical protein